MSIPVQWRRLVVGMVFDQAISGILFMRINCWQESEICISSPPPTFTCYVIYFILILPASDFCILNCDERWQDKWRVTRGDFLLFYPVCRSSLLLFIQFAIIGQRVGEWTDWHSSGVIRVGVDESVETITGKERLVSHFYQAHARTRMIELLVIQFIIL